MPTPPPPPYPLRCEHPIDVLLVYSGQPLVVPQNGPSLPSLLLSVHGSYSCEAGVEHPELESALWSSTAAAARALEHTAKAVDYPTLCEGLARLYRVVEPLLLAEAAANSSGYSQPEQRVRKEGKGGGGDGGRERLACTIFSGPGLLKFRPP